MYPRERKSQWRGLWISACTAYRTVSMDYDLYGVKPMYKEICKIILKIVEKKQSDLITAIKQNRQLCAADAL